VAPLDASATWADVREVSRRIALRMVRDAPDRYVAIATKARRKGRIFVDWLRNGSGATAIATWSMRARPGAPVAAALRWEDLAAFDPSNWSVPALDEVPRDPWDGFADVVQRIGPDTLARLGNEA
jgi:bifunctional non-homologous end joining protein LigD